MQENNFETIISKWRRISVVEKMEKKEALASFSMAGDSSNHQPFLEHKDEASLLVPESKASTSSVKHVALAGTVLEMESKITETPLKPKEMEVVLSEEDSEGASDIEKTDDNLDDKVIETAPDKSDHVDSVFLRSPPAHKAPPPPPPEEEDCAVKCLYYTLQCCDCVLM